MALTVNTNLSSLIVQQNLNDATTSLNKAIERMTTGYKINHAKDNAAGYSIATNWTTQLGSIDVALENASMGMDMLTTMEGNLELITGHLQRIRDLTEQAANGTFGTTSLAAIKEEMTARTSEITRIASNAEYNGIKLFNGGSAVNLQVGIKQGSTNTITLAATLFAKADATALLSNTATFLTNATTTSTAAAQLATLDTKINSISERATKIGALQNSLESAISALNVQSQNVTSSLSTIRDSDVAAESSAYIKSQILQQASATLLSTANQAPSIALNLI